MKRKKLSLILVSLTLLVTIGGCTSLSYTLTGSEKREEMLSKRANKFQQALYWGDVQKASIYLHNDVKDEIQHDLREKKDKRRIIESELTDVEIDNDTDSAIISMRIKYYNIPNYVVKERFEDQKWIVDGGIWFLSKRTFRES